MGGMLQRKILETIHYALNPRGFVFLGSSETIGGSADLFSMACKNHKIYRKKDIQGRVRYEPDTVSISYSIPNMNLSKIPTENTKPVDLGRAAESIILNQYGPPGVVVNERLDAIQFIGHTGPYLDPAPGAASLNLIKLAHPDLSIELRVAAHEAIRGKKSTHKANTRLRHNGNIEEINIDVVPIPGTIDDDAYYLVLFQRVCVFNEKELKKQELKDIKKPVPANKKALDQNLEKELEANRAYMQSIIEEQEATNEELQSANEEIQSTNEELQSTNEELETAKEELQSTNEELITVNEELESRNAELSTANNDLRNIITSADLPIILLNDELSIRYFSSQVYQILNLIESDIGRPLSNIRSKIDTGDISEWAHNVIETLKPMITEVHDDKGHTYSMRIRPYRTEDNRITGVVIVFFDITDIKIMERTRRLATVVEDSNDAITVLGFDGHILAWNPRATEYYGYTEDEALNMNIDAIVPKMHIQETLDVMEKIRKGDIIKPYETMRRTKNGDKLKVMVTMSVLRDGHKEPRAVATTERLLSG
jgi:two-component system CheB/CheR fusion protein